MGWWGARPRAGRDEGGAVTGEAGDAVDACGLNGLGKGHHRQDGGEPSGPHRLARPSGAKQAEIIVQNPFMRFSLASVSQKW